MKHQTWQKKLDGNGKPIMETRQTADGVPYQDFVMELVSELVEPDPAPSLAELAFVDLRTELQSKLGISANSPDQLAGKMGEVLTKSQERMATALGNPQPKVAIAELQQQVEMLFKFVVLLSRRMQ